MATRSIRRLALGVVAALALAGCGGGSGSGTVSQSASSDAGTPTVGGTLNVGVAEDFDSLEPHAVRGETGSVWEALVYETLVGVDQSANPVPGIAKSWTISADGLTYTFLLDDATFSDGSPVTSQDIVWNYEQIAKPDSGASQQAFFAQITKMETPDPKTLVIHLGARNAAFLSVLAIQGRAGIESPKNFEGTTMVNHIGSGPYLWDSYAANDRLVLKANPNYWRGTPPNIAEIDVRILPDDNARLQALSSGELDMAFGLDAAQATAASKDGSFTLQADKQNRGNFFTINTTKAPFSDVRVRQAMDMAVSRQDIATAGWGGFATPTNQPFDADSPWFVKGDFPVTADIEGAKSLIKAAGAEGTPVNMIVWDALGSEQEAQIVASAWKEIGLDPKITKVDITTLVTSTNKGDFDVAYLWIGLITDPTRPYAYLAGDNANNGLAGLLKDDTLTQLVKQAASEADTATRRDLYAQILKMNYEQAAVYYTVNPTILVGVGNRLQGYQQGTYNVVYRDGGLPEAWLKTG